MVLARFLARKIMFGAGGARFVFPTAFATALIAALTTAPTTAQAEGFDPRDNCNDMMVRASEAEKVMIAAWSFGYLSAKQGDARPVDTANNGVILRNLAAACAGNPGYSLLEIVDASRKPAADTSGSEAHARAMLMGFYAPDADLVGLTAALRPSEADIRAVYGEPLATKLVAGYGRLFKPGTKFGPKPEHDDLIVVRATTAGLKAGDAVLSDFPGGYKDVLPYMIRDVPIVRFKFIPTGETLGLAFDGLIFVNGRWVLMPKPWRYLE